METKHLAIIGIITSIILMLMSGSDISEGDKSTQTVITMILAICLFAGSVSKMG